MATLEGKRILFADDETYSMQGTIDALKADGAIVDVVIDGTEVLEYLRKHQTDPPDLLILAIMMAGGSEIDLPDRGRTTGVEVYRKMQEEKIRIPTVISTVVTDRSILDDLRLQRIPILQKPYRFEELERQILKLLTERERR